MTLMNRLSYYRELLVGGRSRLLELYRKTDSLLFLVFDAGKIRNPMSDKRSERDGT